jgi:hypothetical protein
MKEINLHTRLDAYLALREALGLSTHARRKLLQDFVAYLEKHGDGKPIRAQLAVDWASSASATCGVSGQAARLGLAHGFLIHLKLIRLSLASWLLQGCDRARPPNF